MIDPNSQLGELLEQGQTVAQNQTQDLVQRVKGQVIGSTSKQASTQAPTQVHPETLSREDDQKSAARTREMVQDLYAPSEDQSAHTAHDASKDAEQLSNIRRQLGEMHKTTYYDPLFAHETRKEPTIKEEQEAEEKQQKMQDLEFQKAKDDQAFAVQLAAQKTERFPGISG